MVEFRTINGFGNNLNDPTLGETETRLIRLFENAYEDGFNTPRGGNFFLSTLPNPRTISNIISDQEGSINNFLNASDWLWQWGQFIDHDLDLNEGGGNSPPEDFTPIVVPPGDPTFPDGTILPFIRVAAEEGTGTGVGNPRETINEITAFIDASSVYGSDQERADFLRSFDKGLLKVSIADNGEELLPENPIDDPLPNASGGVLGEFQFVAGDIRANEQIGLTGVHNLFVREHNRLAALLHKRLEGGEVALLEKLEEFVKSSSETDEAVLKDEFIYQAVRKVVGAKIQKITYDEFLPLLIGHSLADYSGYDSTVDPSVSTEFANAAYRLGHTLLSDQLKLLNGNGLDEIALKDAFFQPTIVKELGVDSALQGLSLQAAQALDNKVVDGVRNFLFGAGTGGFDLAAINIARGRDVGLPSYVEVYNQLFPNNPITSFDNLPFREGLGGEDGLFAQAYESIDEIDLWVGGISEASDSHGGLLGPTFSAIVADQFGRARDGDRFFYLNDQDHVALFDPDFAATSLSQVIRQNTANRFLVPDNAFQVPYDNSIFGDDSNNLLLGTTKADLIDGGAENDKIKGRFGDDYLFGGTGDDTVKGGFGNDTVFGGEGNDFAKGNFGNDVVLGGDGDDTVYGGIGKDTLIGGNGDDLIKGGSGNDLLNGVGDELGSNDHDILNGGSGSDTYILGEDGQVFYEGDGAASIIRFNKFSDEVQLVGSAADYQLNTAFGDTELSLAGSNDVIAIFENRTLNNFNQGFTFV